MAQQRNGALLERYLFGVIIRDGLWCRDNILETQPNGLLSRMKMSNCRPGFRRHLGNSENF